jgi:hypothetical protein
MTQRVRYSVALAAILVLFLGACGDDDDGSAGGGGGQLSEEAFCAQLAAMEDSDADITDSEALAQLAALARQAPTAEMRSALGKFAEIAQELEGFDEDDPAAVGAAFALIFDPEVMAAMETIETYLEDTCGIEVDSDDDFMWDEDDDLE